MEGLILPEGYKAHLSQKETQKAIKITKDTFQTRLATALNLDRVTAPVVVAADSGINDDLSGVERKVTFDMLNIEGTAEIVQSLAKWKRMALYRYGYLEGEGIYTDMTAIRRDERGDSIHSIYVDQWDWERVVNKDERNMIFLKKVVTQIVEALAYTKKVVNKAFPALKREINTDVCFITTQELEDMYPDLTPKERENKITKERGTVFLMQIGDILASGERHDSRAPDYDDWTLNGDILIWDEVLNIALEVSSMGIRVDAETLLSQLEKCDAMDRLKFQYHKGIMDGTLPLTIGGGIGQSRICMLLLEKAHIGEVQVALWPQEMIDICKDHNIILL